MVEKQPLASAQECMWMVAGFIIFQREFSGGLSWCVLEMYDFLTFISGTVLDDGTISFLVENFLKHQMSSAF